MAEGRSEEQAEESVLSAEQHALLDMYLKNLDDYLSSLKEAEKREVEIETEHLKSVLTKW